MIIAGGIYLEYCIAPSTKQLLGSAGRSIYALSLLRHDLELHTYHPTELWPDVMANFAPVCSSCEIYPSSTRIEFSYLFPLGRPVQTQYLAEASPPPRITGEHVLRFGCVEGDFVVHGDVVVVDFQGSTSHGFRAEGSHAERLGIVLNAREAMERTGQSDLADAARDILCIEDAEVVVVKDGPNGATVHTKTEPSKYVPAYSSRSLYKIGSGDIFSSVFAHYWMSGSAPALAADMASRYTAAYVESPSLPLSIDLPRRKPRAPKRIDRVVIAATDKNIKDTWFLSIVCEAIYRVCPVEISLTERDKVGEWIGHWLHTSEVTSILWVIEESVDLETTLLDLDASDLGMVFYVSNSTAEFRTQYRNTRAFTDLSQAIYELFWEPQ